MLLLSITINAVWVDHQMIDLSKVIATTKPYAVEHDDAGVILECAAQIEG
jgi:hypothetical protein